MPARSVPVAWLRSDRGNAAVTDVAVIAVSTLLLLTILKIASLLTQETEDRLVEITSGGGQSADRVTHAASTVPATVSVTDAELWTANSPVLQSPGSAAAAHLAFRLPMDDRATQQGMPDNSDPITAEPNPAGPEPIKPRPVEPVAGEPTEPVEPTEPTDPQPPAEPAPARPARPRVRPAPEPRPEEDPRDADPKSEVNDDTKSQSENSGIPGSSGSVASGPTAAGGALPGPTPAMGLPSSGFPSGGFPGSGFPGNANGMFPNAGWGSPQPPFPYPPLPYDPRSQTPWATDKDAAMAELSSEPAENVLKSRTSGRTLQHAEPAAAVQRKFNSNRADASGTEDTAARHSEPSGIVMQTFQHAAEAFGVDLTEERTIEVVQFDNSNADRPKLELICHRRFRQLQVYSGNSPEPLAFEAPPTGERRALPLHVDWSQPGTVLRIYGIEEESAEMLRYTIPDGTEESESALEPDPESNQAADYGDDSLDSEGNFVLPPLAEVKGE